MHVWLRLSAAHDRHAFAASLKNRQVLVRPATFAVDDTPPPNAVRLSLSSPLERGDRVRPAHHRRQSRAAQGLLTAGNRAGA
ncbi:hypothetical protein MESS2_1000079 [Mesorhizobium metallidurans STM 2683]|nr:hypothetical protein [Mesorhizobium metallidurans]CCV03065.1 hypothetical protein MESS2_1000079 [Mesorhizobium metallidurans STM 2683]